MPEIDLTQIPKYWPYKTGDEIIMSSTGDASVITDVSCTIYQDQSSHNGNVTYEIEVENSGEYFDPESIDKAIIVEYEDVYNSRSPGVSGCGLRLFSTLEKGQKEDEY